MQEILSEAVRTLLPLLSLLLSLSIGMYAYIRYNTWSDIEEKKLEKESGEKADEAHVKSLVARARVAQQELETYSQQQVDDLIRGIVWACCQPGVAEYISQFAVDETKLGNFAGKFGKVDRKCRAALMDIIHEKSVGVIEEDVERQLVKIAKPVGVIGASCPCTNCAATPIIKAINAIKGRNAIVLTPHPMAKRTNTLIVNKMRTALVKMGAPADLILAIRKPSRFCTKMLMRECDLVFVTGGPGMVKAAYSSGKPALGVGAGNAVITVDETADITDAAKKICLSKTLDLSASCSSDNAVIGVDVVYDELLAALKAAGGYVATEADTKKIAKILWTKTGCLSRDAVVKAPQRLAQLAGFSIAPDRKFIIVKETGVGPEHPFSGEKLSPILALYRVKGISEAIELTNRIQTYQGTGHSCGIYSKKDANIFRLSQETKTSRVMVNQPQSASNSGALWNGMRQTFSLGCGTWGGNSTNENINWRHLVNITWVSKPLPVTKSIPADLELFGQEVMSRVGTRIDPEEGTPVKRVPGKEWCKRATNHGRCENTTPAWGAEDYTFMVLDADDVWATL